MEKRDLLVIGGGPAGAATAIRAARAGVNVTVFEKGTRGRDKVCGDGLTPRAVAALHELEIDMDDAHRIDGLRMIAGTTRRELPWPDNDFTQPVSQSGRAGSASILNSGPPALILTTSHAITAYCFEQFSDKVKTCCGLSCCADSSVHSAEDEGVKGK